MFIDPIEVLHFCVRYNKKWIKYIIEDIENSIGKLSYPLYNTIKTEYYCRSAIILEQFYDLKTDKDYKGSDIKPLLDSYLEIIDETRIKLHEFIVYNKLHKIYPILKKLLTNKSCYHEDDPNFIDEYYLHSD